MTARLAPAGIRNQAKNPPSGCTGSHEKPQFVHRCASPFIRHLLACFRAGQIDAASAAAELRLARRRFTSSTPKTSTPAPTARPTPGLRVAPAAIPTRTGPPRVRPGSPTSSSSKPPSSCGACASERHRRLAFQTDRASVRRWALQHQRTPDPRDKQPPKPVKRWQARDDGALWPYDASPHAWRPHAPDKQVRLDLRDDATRFNRGARLYHQETLRAHFDFLSRVFQVHGLPLALYVDCHSFFHPHTPDACPHRGAALHFYGVDLRYAPTPHAKGKSERRHDDWQKRLPALLIAHHILELGGANHQLDQVVPHAHAHEIHREIGMTPQAARAQALAEKRSVLRPVPACSWWPFVWSQRARVRVGDDGKVPVGAQRPAPP